jgi:hypothetical protein
MRPWAKRMLLAVGLLFAVGLVIAGWAATKLVTWARDLPNRVVIDGDAIANSFGQAVTESYHLALREGDSATQLQVLNDQFVPLIRQHDEGAAWIQKEYGDDINALADSDDAAVSAAASNIIELLDAKPQTVQRPNGG